MGAARSFAVAGPYFEQLSIGDRITAPAATLTNAHVALHQAIVGDRFPVFLDARLSERVFGVRAVPAGLATDIAIGQSSAFTRRVRANLFYRGLQLHRVVVVGDTLSTTAEVVALKQNRRRTSRPATGLAVLRICTVDQDNRVVLDFERCAMIPLGDEQVETGHRDDVTRGRAQLNLADAATLASAWRMDALREAVPGPHADQLQVGDTFLVREADPVTAATELARLTMNIAEIHHDPRSTDNGRRLVYGGHTIGLAAHQAAKALPGITMVMAWEACTHTAPVYEGDLLTSEITVEHLIPLRGEGSLAHLHTVVHAQRVSGPAQVLDWRYVAAIA